MSTGNDKQSAAVPGLPGVAVVVVVVVAALAFWFMAGGQRESGELSSSTTGKASPAPAPVASGKDAQQPVGGRESVPTSSAAILKLPQAGDGTEKLPPISGELAEEIRRLESRDERNTEIIELPDGSQQVKINEGYKSTTVATFDENGKLVVRHGGDFLGNVEGEAGSGSATQDAHNHGHNE